jgi:transglutaminase-like putative cysteine protease
MLPTHVARLAGFAALALLGVLEWQRLIVGLSTARALLWVVVAVGAGLAVLWASTRRRWAATLTIGATFGSLLAAYAASGLPLYMLKPRQWDDLASGLWSGAEALGTVQLPYAAADPWPALTLQLLGVMLCTLGGLLAFWPRENGRGHLFLSLSTLLVMVASPVVSIGGSNQVLLGVVLALLTVCFLWLERLPRRSWIGVAVLAIAVAGAVPLASAADGDQPWFDYRAWAEEFGPGQPVAFNWGHSYGPLDWPREGSEVLRVDAQDPAYWKVEDLDEFDGAVWTGSGPSLRRDGEDDLPSDYRQRPQWTKTFRVTVRRLEGREVVRAGTALRVEDSSRPVHPGERPGSFVADDGFTSGDSYTVVAHIPKPSPTQLAEATSGRDGRHLDSLRITVPLRRDAALQPGIPRTLAGAAPESAVVLFPPFDAMSAGQKPIAGYIEARQRGRGPQALRASHYAQTWALAQRLRADATTPYDYVLAIDRYLQNGFTYSEIPTPTPPDRAVLDAFLTETKSGYCQHFSGAMALMLRMGGVPARVVTGFAPGGHSDRKDAWIVRDTDAHSWVEAWFDEYGWVTLDPTPPATPARSQIAALTAPPESSTGANGDAPTGSNPRTGGVRPDLLGAQDGPGGAGSSSASDGGGISAWWIVPPLAAALLGGMWWLLRRRWRSHPVGGRFDRLVAELEAALRRLGRPATAGMTLQQVEAGLRRTPQAAAYVRALRAGRYSPAASLPTAAQRRALRSALMRGRGPLARARAFWSMPPWRS